MTTFLLVHGAWLGGWFWGRVRSELDGANHHVFAPTLTGLGERVHLANPEVGLATHIQDIAHVIEYESLHKFLLVGHGYGGMVITGLAARMPQKIRHLVYLDAVMPNDGESFCDLIGAEAAQKFRDTAEHQGQGWLLPFTTPLENWGITSEVDVRWTNYRLTPHPWKTMTDALELRGAAAAIPRTFIRCTRPANPRIETSAARARASGSRWHELATGHAAPVTQARELARLLLTLIE